VIQSHYPTLRLKLAATVREIVWEIDQRLSTRFGHTLNGCSDFP
jgi:hypothetical protein